VTETCVLARDIVRLVYCLRTNAVLFCFHCSVAFAAFDTNHSGYLSFSSIERYFESFFTVVFDLSVSLQTNILAHTDCRELAHAVTKSVFASVRRTAQISYAEFHRWYTQASDSVGANGRGGGQGGIVVQDSEEEEYDEEEYASDEQDEDEQDEAHARAYVATREQRFKAFEEMQAANQYQASLAQARSNGPRSQL
jgi:hypothetical protein